MRNTRWVWWVRVVLALGSMQRSCSRVGRISYASHILCWLPWRSGEACGGQNTCLTLLRCSEVTFSPIPKWLNARRRWVETMDAVTVRGRVANWSQENETWLNCVAYNIIKTMCKNTQNTNIIIDPSIQVQFMNVQMLIRMGLGKHASKIMIWCFWCVLNYKLKF